MVYCCLVLCSNVRIETISSFGIIMQAVTSKDVGHSSSRTLFSSTFAD